MGGLLKRKQFIQNITKRILGDYRAKDIFTIPKKEFQAKLLRALAVQNVSTDPNTFTKNYAGKLYNKLYENGHITYDKNHIYINQNR